LVRRVAVASTKRTGRAAHKKYIPSEKQRAEDQRVKEKLEHLTKADLREFDKILENAINHVFPPIKD